MSQSRTVRRSVWLVAITIAIAGCASDPRPKPNRSSDSTPRPTSIGHSSDAAHRDTPRDAPANMAARLRADAPMRYTVERDDTLWGIARTYLDEPQYWPEFWQAGEAGAESGAIHPGDVLVLSRDMNGQPRLSRDGTVRLSPRIREKPVSNAVPVIPYEAIREFLESPRLVDPATLDAAPYVVSIEDEHLIAGNGATLYVRGVPADALDRYDLVHPTKPYRDPAADQPIGRRVVPVGRVTLGDTDGSIVRATLDKAYREARPGDRLIPAANDDLLHDFYPQKPAVPVNARIVSVYGGVSQIGQYDVVTLDQGTADGLARGDVLDIYQAGRTIVDPVAGDEVELPEVEAGRLMLFKTGRHLSFGLVMHATRAIHVDDVVHAPTADPAL